MAALVSVKHHELDALLVEDALLVVTPEHNRSIPAVLKNAIDWGSKPTDRNIWKGKVAAITGTSPARSVASCARSLFLIRMSMIARLLASFFSQDSILPE